jgi:uncharacterized protein Usg
MKKANTRKPAPPPEPKGDATTSVIFRSLTAAHAKLIDNVLLKHYNVGTRSGAVVKMLEHWQRERDQATHDAATVRTLGELVATLSDAQQDAETADRATERTLADLFTLGKSLRKLPKQLRVDVDL